MSLWMALLVFWSTTLVLTHISKQLKEGLSLNFVPTFVVARGFKHIDFSNDLTFLLVQALS